VELFVRGYGVANRIRARWGAALRTLKTRGRRGF
jgi:hypothetical protein